MRIIREKTGLLVSSVKKCLKGDMYNKNSSGRLVIIEGIIESDMITTYVQATISQLPVSLMPAYRYSSAEALHFLTTYPTSTARPSIKCRG